MVSWLPENYSRVLEIGCADGHFRNDLSVSCEYWGIEPDHETASQAVHQLPNIIRGTYLEAHGQLPDEYFDLIICNDVIEHMQDHDLFFEMIKHKMVHKACLVGSVPNVRYVRTLYELLVNKDWKYSGMGVLDRTHLRHFTEKSLRQTILDHGFVINRFHGIKSTLINSFTLRNKMKNVLIRLIILGTLGYYADIQYPQFGFQIQYFRD